MSELDRVAKKGDDTGRTGRDVRGDAGVVDATRYVGDDGRMQGGCAEGVSVS